ncbi:VOC family protein [Amycolatopsis acidiphila]|uniref:VOC family protein n=1 Tax=Amycolatopsis acidiphila TaxID=715473 RepID=A0A558AJN5_9PSEU|nr:VOC family protein [Amycolatopsis acidiphila]TVT24484.1 VOC family protein [Amycolatopsis acidiphila]UIJ59305.1 VOC family protein [Amycolatopsis acidiphila]GHG79613.1 VOC family protein [Amycolatopsis acidiphila]
MTSRLNPYLSFAGDAREAMEFYRDVFGGRLDMSTFGEFGAPDEALADKIMHSRLETPGGFTLMGSDLPPSMEYRPGTTISISLSGDDADELRGYWSRLSEGGSVLTQLEKQMWGDEFGMCVDRFGVQWLVDIGQSQG